MEEFRYIRPLNWAEAAAVLSETADGKILAGGQTLIPTMKQRLATPSDLLDIQHLSELDYVSITEQTNSLDTKTKFAQTVTIGAVTTHSSVAANEQLASLCPAICSLAGRIGDPAVRNLGTIGGSVANNDPAADYPAALMSLNAIINTQKRSINADKFFVGLYETALDEDEIILSISFKLPKLSGYSKFPNPASLYAMVGVFVSKFRSGTVRVAITGAGIDGVFRHLGLEKKLESNFSPDIARQTKIDANDLLSDLHCDSDYRAHLISVMASEAVQTSLNDSQA
jgi:carbon-monoxide dehydrogenase medium subunit|tara:strand:+ start:7776 stop:8627 length:852 start_codon:yes stop_codon:yes gene_type:complete